MKHLIRIRSKSFTNMCDIHLGNRIVFQNVTVGNNTISDLLFYGNSNLNMRLHNKKAIS